MTYDYGNTVGLDFETYGSLKLKDVGMERYVRDPFFQPLIARVVKETPTRKVTYRVPLWDNNFGRISRKLVDAIGSNWIASHNAPFEKRVLRWLNMSYDADRFIDTVVVARAAGADGKLEKAGPQLLGGKKLPAGAQLMKVFCMPGEYQEKNGSMAFDPQVIIDNPKWWAQFDEYCGVDSELSLDLAVKWGWVLTAREPGYAAITTEMNEVGWPVDIDMVKEMQRRYHANMDEALAEFQREFSDAPNLNSLPQQRKWVEARGIKATSFDKDHVATLLMRIEKKLEDGTAPKQRVQDYHDVATMLRTKQILGGASLKKLQVILDTECEGRVYQQYFHAGAGQTMRTSGRSVQMQNLKRLNDHPAEMSELIEDPDFEIGNSELSDNLRQVFRASHTDGHLIVGDFSQIESRGLAYQAGSQWKLDAFRQGRKIYELQAAKIYGIRYEDVTKAQRQTGKVGELSCGYQASGPAVMGFAKGMGVVLSEPEAAGIVRDWRAANPEIVKYWWALDDLLHACLEKRQAMIHYLPFDDLVVVISPSITPSSLNDQKPGAQSIEVTLEVNSTGRVIMRRYFNGCYVQGRSIQYFKPSGNQTGALWKPGYKDPKTKQYRFYSVYGGKLAGIITQSLCREMFFEALSNVRTWVSAYDNVDLIGQFHDEIVLDWWPGPDDRQVAMNKRGYVMSRLDDYMSKPPDWCASFPVAAEIKSDYRYTK